MKQLREIVTLGLQKRAEAKIKVRQPLPMITLGEKYADTFLDETLKLQFYTDIAAEELNVREVRFVPNQTEDVVLDTNITPELKLEGEAREIIRAIQEGRKKAGFNVEDRISLGYTGKDAVFANAELGDLIAHETLATEVQSGTLADAEYSETTEIEGKAFAFTLRRSK